MAHLYHSVELDVVKFLCAEQLDSSIPQLTSELSSNQFYLLVARDTERIR